MSGDLISKQALLKEIKKKIIPDKYGTSSAVLDVIGAVLRVIREQTIAYDVEKVIDKLKEDEQEITSQLEESAKNTPDAVQETNLRVAAQLFRDYTKSQIEIVKSGGIDAGQKGEQE